MKRNEGAVLLFHLMAVGHALTLSRERVAVHRWPESECRCEGSFAERHVDYVDPEKLLPAGLERVDFNSFTRLREEFQQLLEGYNFNQLSRRVDIELELAANDPDHPLRVLEDMGTAEYGQFVLLVQKLAQAWGLRRNMLQQRGTFLSWMRVPGDQVMPCICPTGALAVVRLRFPRESFTNGLAQVNSEEYIAFTTSFQQKVSMGLSAIEPAIVDVHVTSLEPGSVVVTSDVLLSTSMDAPLAQSKVRAALEAYLAESSPPGVETMPVDTTATTYQVLECGDEAPPAPENGVRSVPAHKTTGTRALYNCQRGYEFSDGASGPKELVCNHVTRQWGVLDAHCDVPKTVSPRTGPTASTLTTTVVVTTTEEPEPNYIHIVTIPSAAGLLLLFFLMIFCVRTQGACCSLLSEDKKKKRLQEQEEEEDDLSY